MGKIVIFSDEISDQLNNISMILYKNQYFGFLEDADRYIEKIHNYVLITLISQYLDFLPKAFKNLENSI